MATGLLWHLWGGHHNPQISCPGLPRNMSIYKLALLCEDSTPLSREFYHPIPAVICVRSVPERRAVTPRNDFYFMFCNRRERL